MTTLLVLIMRSFNTTIRLLRSSISWVILKSNPNVDLNAGQRGVYLGSDYWLLPLTMFKISLIFSFSTSTPTTHPSKWSSWYPTHVTSFWKPLSVLSCCELRTLLKSPNFARVSNITLNLYEVGTRRSRVLWITVKLVARSPPAVKTWSMFLKMNSRDWSVWNNGQKI